jgi:hypothetical protein
MRRGAPGSRLRARLRLFRLHRPPGSLADLGLTYITAESVFQALARRRSGSRPRGGQSGERPPRRCRGDTANTGNIQGMPGTRIGCGCRTGAERCPGSGACALTAAVVAGQRDRDDRNGRHQPQHQHCLPQARALIPPAGMSRSGARTPDRPPRADMDLLTRRHLFAGCQPGEYGQPRGQRRVTAGQIVPNRVQGLLLPRAQAHHRSPDRFAAAPAVAATVRATALARTTLGSRGPGGRTSCQGRSRRTLGRWKRIRSTVLISSASHPSLGPTSPARSRVAPGWVSGIA